MSNSSAWKVHELSVAKYFNTSRRCRGDDFSNSDIEILTTTREWLGWDVDHYIGVECKYRKDIGIINVFTKLKKSIDTNSILILKMDDVYVCNMDSFDKVYIEWLYKDLKPVEEKSLRNVSCTYSIINSNRQPQKYLYDYLLQAREYKKNLVKPWPFLPLVCIRKKSGHTKLIVFSELDLMQYHSDCCK
jgi:hypothetical protein